MRSVDSTWPSPAWSSVTVQQVQVPGRVRVSKLAPARGFRSPGRACSAAKLSLRHLSMVEVTERDSRPEMGRRDADDGRALHHCQPRVLPGACKALLHKSHLCFGANANPPGTRHEAGFGLPALAAPCQVSGAPLGLSMWEAGDLG